VEKIQAEAERFEQRHGREPVIACLGLAFKPNIDDLRESPALYVFQQLVATGIQPLAVEPNLKQHESLTLTPWKEAVEQADIVACLVAHREFKNLDTNGHFLDFCGICKL
jgi:UDP-N-acetyl-D-mannosaminuronic acid dehydrogenase